MQEPSRILPDDPNILQHLLCKVRNTASYYISYRLSWILVVDFAFGNRFAAGRTVGIAILIPSSFMTRAKGKRNPRGAGSQ